MFIKRVVLLVLLSKLCFAADDGQELYGTTDNPQINGVTYDVHKAFIEPNAGFQPKVKQSDNPSQNNSDGESQKQIMVKPLNHQKVSINQNSGFSSDAWASNSNVEKALKQAASEGKLSTVLAEAKKANVPASVAIVPIVESNYNKSAVSPKGAVGAWQIMQGTAADYGLSPSDRTDFNRSTAVAIQILNDLHSEFGNWALAFAAYNCGDRCVLNALKKNPNATSIDELSLPKETKDYVHKIVQINQIIAGLDKKNQLADNKIKQ